MIVQCENCETRFHVADARIPEKGARVRCSRCHHRFHITPSSGQPTAQGPAADVSARTATRGESPGGGAAGEDDLDNPEFLFEESGSKPQATPARAKPAVAEKEPEPEPPPAAPPEPEPVEAKPPSPDLEPAAAPEERVVETRGKTAQEMLDMGAPKLGGGAQSELSISSSDSDDTRSRFFLGEESPTAPAEPPPSLRPAKDKPAKPSAPPKATLTPIKREPVPAPSKPKPAVSELDAAFGAGISDDEETDPGWESLTKDETEPRSVFDAGASFGLVANPEVASASDKPAKATAFEQPEGSANTKKHRAEAPVFDPEAPSSMGVISRFAAVLVGVALLGGTWRGLEMQRDASHSGAEAEQAAGWIATDVETFVARDSLGVRVLVVRGNLFPNGAAAPPDVEVSLLESDGRRVGEPRRAWLERLDDAEIAPDELTVRLASDDISGRGPQVTGFTALLPDPPARARRVQVSLLAGEPTPTPGTATAVTPPPAAPQPSDSSGSQLATPEAPAQPKAPAPDAGVPAAPEPE
jgi:predicted Zn finger-like uncharacterized protein